LVVEDILKNKIGVYKSKSDMYRIDSQTKGLRYVGIVEL